MKLYDMADSRRCQVVLLDDTKITLTVQPKMLTADLFDMVASHLGLREKEYFGLFYLDESSSQQWLQSDRKVVEHEVYRRTTSTDVVVLYLAVRFYIEDIRFLTDIISVELYYLQVRRSVYQGLIEADSATVFELAAYSLQISHPDLNGDEETRNALKQLAVFPTTTLREHPSIQYCEEQVMRRYCSMNGISRGQAVISYMSIVEQQPTYGIHYYDVKNKQGIVWWLGLSFKGIAEYDQNDKRTPRRVFPWKYLENLYFRDKKFSIEVHDPKRVVHALSSFNLYEDAIREPAEECDDLSDAISHPTTQVSVSRRTFGPSNVNVYAWFTQRPQLTKSIWSMAVCQHQFFLDRLQNNKNNSMMKHCPNRLADEITYNPKSLLTKSQPSSTDLNLNIPQSALNTLTASESKPRKPKLTPEERAKQRETYRGLSERKNKLEEVLQGRILEIKQICLREAEITGDLPPEYTMFMSADETTPTIKRRMGTAFSIADLVSRKSDALTKFEMEFEVQKQITKAKQKLANDESLSKHVRKKHKIDYVEAHAKLQQIGERVKHMRERSGFDTGSFTSEDNTSLAGSFAMSGSNSSINPSMHSGTMTRSPSKPALMQSRDGSPLNLPGSKVKATSRYQMSAQSSTSSLASITHSTGEEQPAAVCQDFTPTRALRYNRSATFQNPDTTTSTGSGASADSGVGSVSSSSLHAYSVPTGRPIRSGSMDDVRMAMPSPQEHTQVPHSRPQPTPPSRSARGYIANNPYGSLERKALKKRTSSNRLGDSQNGLPPPAYPTYRKQQPSPQPTQHNSQQARHREWSGQATGQAGRSGLPPADYAQNVQQASKRMFNDQPAAAQPFQMLYSLPGSMPRDMRGASADRTIDRQYYTQQRTQNREQIPPIAIPPRQHDRSGNNDSNSNASSPKENAFSFFTSNSQFPLNTEISKPLEFSDCMQYSEKLRRARGLPSQSSRESTPPTPAPRRQLPSSHHPSHQQQQQQQEQQQEQPLQNGNSSNSRDSSRSASRSASRSVSPYVGYSPAQMTNSYERGQSPSPHNTQYNALQPNGGPYRAPPGNPRADSSFNTGDVGDNFSQEMYDWYQGQDDQTKSTLV